ncbi:MAG: hypothetical protein M3Z66_21580 [Chloroflexota bacterium]|nr:hypothetical protein [Chloroflexota bacterium]
MSELKPCVVCGADVGNDPNGAMQVSPNAHGSGRVTYFCAEHNPNPPTAEQLADRERQDLEAGAAELHAEEGLIRQLIDLDHPVTPVDRANIGTILLRLQQRWIALHNQLQVMQGKPIIPLIPPPSKQAPMPKGGDTPVSEPDPPRPLYRVIVDHLWTPTPDEQIYHGTDVRFGEVLQAVQHAGGTYMGGMHSEQQSQIRFHAPTEDVVDRVRESLDIPTRHRVQLIQYLPEFPYGAPLVIWRHDLEDPAHGPNKE